MMQKKFPRWLGIFLGLGLALTPSLLQSADFAAVTPGRVFIFPRDHGAHPEFQNEWWYVTGHVKSEGGREFGFQWTIFRTALPKSAESSAPANARSAWRTDQIYLGHAALSDLHGKSFSYSESAGRGALGIADASRDTLNVHLPKFRAEMTDLGWKLKAQGEDFSYECLLTLPASSQNSIVLQGQNGYSPKANDGRHASYYYSVPRQKTRCRIHRKSEVIENASGEAWFDHEFGSNQLSETQTGWDWFGLHLSEGRSLMIYRLRDRSGQDFLSGSLTDAEGKSLSLTASDIHIQSSRPWKSPRSEAVYPMEWKLEIPSQNLKLKVEADFHDQELITRKTTQVTYWEGSASVTEESARDLPVTKGYLEMTGYDAKNKPKL